MDQIESKQRFHYEHKHLIKFIIGMEQFTQLTIRFTILKQDKSSTIS